MSYRLFNEHDYDSLLWPEDKIAILAVTVLLAISVVCLLYALQ